MNKREYHLIRKYGITSEQYDEVYRKQEGRCAVCHRHGDGFSVRLCVDHDHSTGIIRGLLCNYCNRYVVGRYRKDKGASLLLAAYEYLNKEYTGWVVPPKSKKKKRRRKCAKTKKKQQ